MNLICIGKLVNTHGLIGEVRIISDFKYKDNVFRVNNNIYINNDKYIIKSYRRHKNFDMVSFDGINKIEDVLSLKGCNVYINRDEYSFDGYLIEDLLNLDVYDEKIYKGKIIDVYKTDLNELLIVDGVKRHMIPNIDVFIKEVDLSNNRIYINYIKGLDNED